MEYQINYWGHQEARTQFLDIQFKAVPKNVNHLADALSQFARQSNVNGWWDEFTPRLCISNILNLNDA